MSIESINSENKGFERFNLSLGKIRSEFDTSLLGDKFKLLLDEYPNGTGQVSLVFCNPTEFHIPSDNQDLWGDILERSQYPLGKRKDFAEAKKFYDEYVESVKRGNYKIIITTEPARSNLRLELKVIPT